MLKTPNNLSKEQQQEYKKSWLSTLNAIMFGIKFLVFFIIGILLYLPLEEDFKNIFKKKEIVVDNYTSPQEQDIDYNKIENGIHVQSGLIYAPGFELVKANCTVCHSAKLVTQNRATKEGWDQMLTWMQETQGLWDLGKNRATIVNYLATNYAPEQKGRRENLNIAEVEWYILNLEDSE